MNTSCRILLSCFALVLLGLIPVASWATSPEKGDRENKNAQKTVSLVIDYGNGKQKILSDIAWWDGMTAWDVTLVATQREPRSQINHKGNGRKIFVIEMDGFKNQGGGPNKRNWQYWVNDVYADVGAGAKVLKADDKVVWKFTGTPAPEYR